jgi:hypothetical protein
VRNGIRERAALDSLGNVTYDGSFALEGATNTFNGTSLPALPAYQVTLTNDSSAMITTTGFAVTFANTSGASDGSDMLTIGSKPIAPGQSMTWTEVNTIDIRRGGPRRYRDRLGVFRGRTEAPSAQTLSRVRVTDEDEPRAAPAEQAGYPVEPETAEPVYPDEPIRESKRHRWRERPSVRDLKSQAMDAHELQPQWDRIENDRTRLADGEAVHLAGIVLADAFTPSTVSSLRKAIEDMPWSQEAKDRWLARLGKGRSAAGASGSVSTAVTRGNSSPFGQDAPALPDQIDAVWLHLLFPTPSLTVIVATFTLSDKAGNLSDYLRADYHTESADFRLTAAGRFGRLRGRIPWARPRYWSSTYTSQTAAEQKRLACESRIKKHEADCRAWIAKSFPGRFSGDRQISGPVVRILLTKAC